MSESYLRKPPQRWLMDGSKYLWHQDKLEDYLQGHRVKPITIDAGIHKSCNIKCRYCYGVKQGKSAEYIPTDRLLMLADDAKKCGIRGIAIIGDGEPTMNKGLYPFVEALNKNEVDCAVATNGLLLDYGKIATLTYNCEWLRFNISGIDKYDWIMGAPKNSLRKFEHVIQEAVRLGGYNNCTIGLQAVLIPECFSEIVPLAKAAIAWGVDYLVIKQFSDAGQGMPMHFDMKEYEKAKDLLHQAEGMSNDKTQIIVKWEAMQATKDITMDKHWGFDRCNDLPFLFQISGNGECYPCGYHFGNPKYCYGSVCNQRLSDILESDRYWEVIELCYKTQLIELCGGQCRHCSSLTFLYELNKVYRGNLQKALIEMCGSKEQYVKLMDNPPEHINFL